MHYFETGREDLLEKHESCMTPWRAWGAEMETLIEEKRARLAEKAILIDEKEMLITRLEELSQSPSHTRYYELFCH